MNRTATLMTVLVLVFGVMLHVGIAAEDYPGKPVHDKACLSCHGVEMYSRVPLFVKSYRQLDAQVNACAKRNNITWTEEQTEDVIDYLCDEFYGFE
jgi:hypothetical protein